MELYIHIPFCRQKCRYCSFTSFVGQEALFDAYTDLLLEEAKGRREELNEPIHTIYIGGGTPSLLPVSSLQKLIRGLRKSLNIDQEKEFTMEANPGTVTEGWIGAAAGEGVNRLSFGMQAYQKEILSLLGRIHGYDDVLDACHLARQAGISNISLDLMFGIPTQTMEQWSETLDAALDLKPVHISAYGLISEEGTPMDDDIKSGKLSFPDPEAEREMYDYAISVFSDHGLAQYEVSNFAVPGYECIHNIGYWTQEPYIGLGVSAASMTNVTRTENGMSCCRKTNPDSMTDYVRMVREKNFSANREIIREKEARFETMMLGLRMNQGVSECQFRRMHRASVEQIYGEKLHNLEQAGLLIHEHGSWKLTRRGFDIQNTVLVELMDD